MFVFGALLFGPYVVLYVLLCLDCHLWANILNKSIAGTKCLTRNDMEDVLYEAMPTV